MHLAELVDSLTDVRVQGGIPAPVPMVRGLTADSREVRAGYIFAALPGAKMDGREFIADAVKQGACAILAPEGTEFPGATIIQSWNARKTFAEMAAKFYMRQPEFAAAVTGTNGKSSTVNFCRQIWQSMDHAAASLGTLGVSSPAINKPGALTTPDPVTLHAELAELEASGVTHLAMEASSQGLDQYRLDGVHLKAAAFTNLTRDHLDYHGSMERYYDAKARLFGEILDVDGVAVVNADTPYSKGIVSLCDKRGITVIEYGYKAQDIRLVKRKPLPGGQFIDIRVFGEKYELELPLVGEFQALNALCALGIVISEESDNRLLHMQGVYALERLQSVRGRLEFAAQHPNGAAIYVDYAHTPDGLETMLKALRPHALGKLHVVFGCGGDRDPGKRPIMGEIAAKLANKVIVTDDNPRTEDAAEIRKAVMKGAKGATEIGSRREAIAAGIRNLGPDDVLVIAGKGHEQGQIVGKDVLPFDDVTEARKAVLEVTK